MKINEVDPDGLQQGDKGAKFDQGKIRVALLKRFGLALLAVADLTTGGAKRYTKHGWADVCDGIERYDDAMLRHVFKEMFEELDPDMNQPHAVSEAWNALARLQLLIEQNEEWKTKLIAGKATQINE